MPEVFVSAVSSELRELRKLVAEEVEKLGYQPVFQDGFDTEQGDLHQVLRRKIDRCEGLIHLVGLAYGEEPTTPEPSTARLSYTQYEFQYASTSAHKKTWVIFVEQGCTRTPEKRLDKPPVGHPRPEEYQRERWQLQEAWRQRLRDGNHIWYTVSSDASLQVRIRDAHPELNVLARRRNHRRLAVWAVVGAAILAGIGVAAWSVRYFQAQ